jgi:2-polyprenyl-3-methyl-5-hydroxy-6-metoxy-1,4-benzoquinol methylase
MEDTARLASSLLIPPLYRWGEGKTELRGTRIRRAIFHTLDSLSRSQAAQARRAFEDAVPDDRYLDPANIDALLHRYSKKNTRGDSRLPREKAAARAIEILKATAKFRSPGTRFLDLACGDGLVGASLANMGYRVSALDLKADRFSPEARSAGVEFFPGNAQQSNLPSRSFDVVFSFDAFEHFLDPPAVLREIHRILKPGGVVYASFGPLYYSAQGAHQWTSVDVPYCHLLFSEEHLNASARSRGKGPLVRNVNKWHLSQFREMLAAICGQFETIDCFEKLNTAFVDLVQQHAAIFRARTNDFDDLIVRSIEMLLRKTG